MSFALYAASSPEVAIDSVKARREIESAPAALREIADEAGREKHRRGGAFPIHRGGDSGVPQRARNFGSCS